MPKPVRKMQKANAALQAAILPKIPPELLDHLVKGPRPEEAAVEEASRAFKKALIERALGAGMSHHAGYATGAAKPDAATNRRNGNSGKAVVTDDVPVRIDGPDHGLLHRDTGRGSGEVRHARYLQHPIGAVSS